VRQFLLNWLLKPVSYCTMIENWHLLNEEMLFEKKMSATKIKRVNFNKTIFLQNFQQNPS